MGVGNVESSDKRQELPISLETRSISWKKFQVSSPSLATSGFASKCDTGQVELTQRIGFIFR